MRKHFTQMTSVEIQHLIKQVRSRSLKFHSHAMQRMRQKGIGEAQILASISYCSIIEAHNDAPNEIRVLVRGKIRGNFVCSVVSLTRNEIITCYWNQADDHHKTLDKSAYTWNADLTKFGG